VIQVEHSFLHCATGGTEIRLCVESRYHCRPEKAYPHPVANITVSIDIAASLDRVWRETADLASHAQWMADAESIEFLTEQRSGVGVRMRVATRVGPFRTYDEMEITEWIDRHSIRVRHVGLVTGEGVFKLDANQSGTRFTWSERLTFPWYLGGPVLEQAAKPILTRVWRRNLNRLRRKIESVTDPS